MENKENELTLDELVTSAGTELADNVQTVTSDIIEQQVNKALDGNLSYEDNADTFSNMLGTSIKFPTADDVTMTKEESHEHIAKQVNLNDIDRENKEFDKLTDAEKIKDYVLKSQYYRETNNFYHKYGYEMTGDQKRYLKRNLERAWKKGKFKLSDADKEDILYELNKASHTPVNAQIPAQNTTNNANGSQYINDLNSLVFKAK